MAYEVWSMIGALITAATFLPLLLSQPCQHQSSRLFRWVRSALFPNHAQCELVTWDMIPDGPLHTCARGYCPHWMPNHHAKCQECWTPCLQVLFNRALRDGGRRSTSLSLLNWTSVRNIYVSMCASFSQSSYAPQRPRNPCLGGKEA